MVTFMPPMTPKYYKIPCLVLGFLLAACAVEPVEDFQSRSEKAAQDLIKSLGPQQTFARLGWQVEPDYKPLDHCFEHWYGAGPETLTTEQVANCELHTEDLSRLYASYGTDAPPIIFKSKYYWAELEKYHLAYPKLVEEWEAAGFAPSRYKRAGPVLSIFGTAMKARSAGPIKLKRWKTNRRLFGRDPH